MVSFLVYLVVSFLVLHQATPFNQSLYLIRLSYLHQTIPQNLLATTKFYQIIQLFLGHLDLLLYTEPAGSFTILRRSASKLQSWEAETTQFYLPLPLPCSNRKLSLKFALGRPSLAASSQLYLLISPQLRVDQQIPRSNSARLHTGVCLHSIAI